MAEPKRNDGNSGISAIPCEELDTPAVQLALSGHTTANEQSSMHTCCNEVTLNFTDISLTKEHEVGSETDTLAERLHGNDHEHNELNLNAELKPSQEEIPTGSVPIAETTDKDEDSHNVTQFKHTDNTGSEEATHESISIATDPQSTYSVQEYKFQNSSEITSVWKEFQKKEDVCMKGCKW
jgi:hypothetical protein